MFCGCQRDITKRIDESQHLFQVMITGPGRESLHTFQNHLSPRRRTGAGADYYDAVGGLKFRPELPLRPFRAIPGRRLAPVLEKERERLP